MQIYLKVFVLLSFILLTNSIDINTSSCINNQYYNYLSFTCTNCPNNQINQSKITCKCPEGTYHNENIKGFNHANACINLTNPVNNKTVKLLRNADGSPNNSQIQCVNSAYPNNDRTKCIPCPSGMTFDETSWQCICGTNFQNVNGKCITKNLNLNQTIIDTCITSTNNINLAYFAIQSCQYLLNFCVKQSYTGGSCNTINNLNNLYSIQGTTFPIYQIPNDELNLNELGITVSTQEFTNTTTLKNKLAFYVAEFDESGAYRDFRPLRNELFSCSLSQRDSLNFQSFGTGFYRECTIKITPTFNYYYDLYIKAQDGANYAQVPIKYSHQSNTTYKKRFSQALQTVKLNLLSHPPLVTPIVTIQVHDESVTLFIQNQSVTPHNYVLMAPFIVLNVIVLGYFIYAMFLHVKYNPENLGQNTYCFRMMWGALWLAMRCWTVCLFVWLAGVSTFAFCFYKLQGALYMILPDPTDAESIVLYYTPFKTAFFVMFSIGIISQLQLIFRITTAEYFVLDWQRPKEIVAKFSTQHGNRQMRPSIWRRLFVVNQLYQLAMKRVASMQFTLLFSGLFLQGLKWSNLKYMTPNTNVNTISNISNPILGYFITTFLLVIISLGQILIRKLLKIWWPLPVQQFIDLCCISNMSIFIFDQGIHAFYIHGMSPLGRAEGSLQHIETIFEKESQFYGRNRGLIQQDSDCNQAFQVIAPRIMRFEFTKFYFERTQQLLAAGVMSNTFFSKPIPQLKMQHYDGLQKLRQDMINTFRLYLQQIRLHKNMQIKQRNWFTRMFSCPPNASLHQKLPVMYKDPDYTFNTVFLSGNQLYILINEINLFNFWYIIIGNTFHAIILTMVFKFIIGMFTEYRMKRNISANTFVDDKFFV